MSQFYLPSASQSASPSSSPRSSVDADLPFPAPLPRSDFLGPDFTPSAYLSAVAPQRHQVLEDLRADLRARSQQLSKELLDLVNAHYVEFLGLGTSLRGGKETVQDLRAGLMGFERELEVVRNFLSEKEEHIKNLMEERRTTRGKLELGRKMIALEYKIGRLQDGLSIGPQYQTRGDHDRHNGFHGLEDDGEEGDNLEDEVYSESNSFSAKPLSPALELLHDGICDYNLIKQSAMAIGLNVPFVTVQQHRISHIRSTLLLDLGNCLRNADMESISDLDILILYNAMDAGKAAVDLLKNRSLPSADELHAND